MIGNRNKKIAVGIVLILLSAGILTATPVKNRGINKVVKEKTDFEIELMDSDEKIQYIFSLKSIDEKANEKRLPLYECNLTKEDAFNMDQRLLEIDQKLKLSSNQHEFIKYLEEKLDVLRYYDCIPSFFSLKNLTQLIDEITEAIKDENNVFQSNIFPDPSSSMPFVGMGPGVFAYVSPLGTTTPYGVFNLTHWSAIGILFQTNITINYSGWYVTSDSPLINDRYYEINSPMWQAMWTAIGKDEYKQYTKMYGIGMYMIQAIIGHTISWSVAGSIFPTPHLKTMAGSFYYFGGPTIPISFTLYKIHPKPWTTIVDIGIVFSLLGQAIFPFWYENNLVKKT